MLIFIVFFPLLGSIISGFISPIIGKKVTNFITSSLLMLSCLFAWVVFFQLIKGRQEHIDIFRFIDVGGLQSSWGLWLDPLSAIMMVVVTTVSFLVNIYSFGYMHKDKHIVRFMCYLSLFSFFMRILITSDNLIQLFFGWEGVGLCSYLLIGFWHHKPSANKAAIKAFIVNRVADVAFVFGIILVYQTFGSVEFSEIFVNVSSHKDNIIMLGTESYNAITVISILLFIGAMGKSAQIGFHTWLPDAMEGPTPVSALIHAATMVTAGIFLLARFSPIIEYSDVAKTIITYVGAATAIFAATIALTQNDIKKIIAYSTCSQLGYMCFACGVSAYSAGIFHLMTHAFFKALLFLCAGSVIHAMSSEQDIRKMGGLWKRIPFTYAMMLIGSISIAGIYPFSGYFSKDIILEAAYASGTDAGQMAYYLGIVGAFLTAFYSFRLIIIVFHGKSNLSKEAEEKVKEPSLFMIIPLAILAVGAFFSGIVGEYLGMVDPNAQFWNKSIFMASSPNILEKAHNIPQIYKLLPLFAGGLGIAFACMLYLLAPGSIQIIKHSFNPLYRLFLNKWYIDEIYDFVIVRRIKIIGTLLWKIFDIKIIDNCGPGGMVNISQRLASIVSYVQSGYIYHYAFIMIIGLTAILTWYIWLLIEVGAL